MCSSVSVCFWFIIGLGTLEWWQLISQMWGHGQRRKLFIEEMSILTESLQARNLQKCDVGIFIHHSLSTCSQDWVASICVLQGISVLVLPSLSACSGTVTKHSCVCFVLVLCNLHPQCPCCSTIVRVANLQQKQREPSPSPSSEIASCSALCPREAPAHLLLWTSKRPHVEWLHWLENQCSPWSCEWVWKTATPLA